MGGKVVQEKGEIKSVLKTRNLDKSNKDLMHEIKNHSYCDFYLVPKTVI